MEDAENQSDYMLIEIISESVVQTYEIAIELAWKTAKAFALKIEPSGRISGSTTAIKLAFNTGVIKSEKNARDILEAIQNRNMSSHEYLLSEGLEEYLTSIRNVFVPALVELIHGMEEML